ncbi:RMD1 family protein [Robertkochia flava]|uniref:RMD1 family protein n=1 Tax=Robertkochia flava TaxID=3447986 RepID=UPI001CC94B6D|nr:RMD1 family protein [Robertkochia marina]
MNASVIRIAQNINLRSCKEVINGTLLVNDGDKLFYAIGEGQYLCMFRYGVIGFFGISVQEEKAFADQVVPFCTQVSEDPFREEMTVVVTEETDRVEFNRISLKSADLGAIKIVMINLAHSVVLDDYTRITENLLEDTNTHTRYLEEKGRISLKGKKLIRYIARVMNIKNRIAENLNILDNSDITWENERLHRLDMELKINFDINDRHRYLEDQLGIVKENLELFKDIMQHRESTILEWIIIILILIEVIDTFWLKFY